MPEPLGDRSRPHNSRKMALLAIPVLVRARRIGVLRLHPVIPHHPFIAPVELLQITHVVHRARQAVGAVFGRHRAQLPDRVLPSLAEALQALGVADRARLPRLSITLRPCRLAQSS